LDYKIQWEGHLKGEKMKLKSLRPAVALKNKLIFEIENRITFNLTEIEFNNFQKQKQKDIEEANNIFEDLLNEIEED
jgi:hypothetical protein